jgi:hypothetical protein
MTNMANPGYYGDSLQVSRDSVVVESIEPVRLAPAFSSQANYNKRAVESASAKQDEPSNG